MADTKTYTTNYNLVKPGQDDFYNVDDFNDNADILDAALHQASTNLNDHKAASVLDHPDNSVTDLKIGNRTITDTVTATTGPNTLTKLLSMLGSMIKSITGKANWYTAPAITLETAKTHVDASAPHNGHETPTGAQSKADAAKSAANSYTDTKTANLVNTSDARLSNARPAAGGTSSYTEYVNNDNTSMRFHWSGQGGQPSWLWGGNDPSNMYVYNPSNFNVNYAATAGSAPANGGTSTYANRLLPISGPSTYKLGYTADGAVQNPGGTWGKVVMIYDGNGQTYGMRVDRADYADSAGNADTVDGYHASQLLASANVAILTGVIAHGGTIPLPSGYTQAQCQWLVSANHLYDSSGGGWTTCSADANRVVTVTGVSGPNTANYIIIGVK